MKIFNTKIFIVIVSIFIILIIGSIGYYFILKDKLVIDKSIYEKEISLDKGITLHDCDQIMNMFYRDYCYLDIAIDKEDSSICDEISCMSLNTHSLGWLRSPCLLRDECYLEMIKSKKDVSICDKMEGMDMKDNCYIKTAEFQKDVFICDLIAGKTKKNWCYQIIAKTTNDLAICDKIEYEDNKSNCYQDIAKIKNDLSICEKIESQKYKDSCYQSIAEIEQDPSICEKIESQDDLDDCFQQIVYAQKNISLCDKMINPENKYHCYVYVSEIGNDSSICEKIENQEEKNNCYQFIAAMSNNLSICEGQFTKESDKDYCYYGVASKNQDISLCRKITNKQHERYIDCYDVNVHVIQEDFLSICEEIPDHEQDREDCFRILMRHRVNASVSFENPISFCEILKEPISRDYCYKYAAINSQYISNNSEFIDFLCNRIQEPKVKNGCYHEVELIRRDVCISEPCELIPIEKYKNYCYLDLGMRAKNIKICDKITNQDVKDLCYITIAGIIERRSTRIRNMMDYYYPNDESNYICEQIQNTEHKDICFQHIKKAIPDIDLEHLFLNTKIYGKGLPM